MKVILISKVVNFGTIGDIVNVKDGFARNFLIPKNKAICYSVANYKIFEEQKSQFEKDNQEKIKKANIIKAKITNAQLTIIRTASDDGRLYGSVSSSVIANEINSVLLKEKLISKSDIKLKKPIKDVGIFDAAINLHSDVICDLKIIVARSESEVASILSNNEKSEVFIKELDIKKERDFSQEEVL